MADERFADYLRAPRGHVPAGAHTGAAGGAACGDLVRLSVAVEGDRVRDAGADAAGCGAALASASAAAALVRGHPVLEAARVSPEAIAAELGGLTPGKQHAAELAADALHRALGAAGRARGSARPQPGGPPGAVSGGGGPRGVPPPAPPGARGRRRPPRGGGATRARAP